MVYEIILGRSDADKKRFGTDASIFVGKQYVKMGAVTTLSQPVYLDLNKAHVVFVCGKRGSGKSYSLGVIAEGISNLSDDYRERINVVILDTMGIYWTMKYANHKDDKLLKEWGLEGKKISGLKIYTPKGYFEKWKAQGIPTDEPFAINPAELSSDDWNLTFELSPVEPLAIFIEKIVSGLRKSKKKFGIKQIIQEIQQDDLEEKIIKQSAENRFRMVDEWGLFSEDATSLRDLIKGGQITVIDLSAYAVLPNGWRIKQLVLGIVSIRLFIERMKARKEEEFETVHQAEHYILEETKIRSKMPIVWVLIDEAHEFLPNKGKTASSQALVTLLREGRQPGIALVLATQQPGKIHTDAMTQSDIILSHRITAKIDTDALANLMQSYLKEDLDKQLMLLPKITGSCIAIDDVNEKIYPMKVRPRFSWHGGGAPELIRGDKKKEFRID